MIDQQIVTLADKLKDEVHVWYASTTKIITDKQKLKLFEILSVEEKSKSEKFVFDTDRYQYMLAHGLLRMSLSKYSDINPSEWVIAYSSKGKPYILNKMEQTPRFNLTHTNGFVACIISVDSACGIDVEISRCLDNFDDICASVCSQKEINQIIHEDKGSRQQKFLKFWVLKEAYVKALGEGVSFGMKRITFEIIDHNIADCYVDDEQISGWRFELFQLSNNGILATAVSCENQNNVNTKYMDFLS